MQCFKCTLQGKSTIAKELSKCSGVDVASSDEVGTDGIKSAIAKTIGKGRHLIIDRVNLHPNDRRMWATEGKKANEACRFVLCWVATDVDTCKARVQTRKDHPTLGSDEGDAVIDRFAAGFKPPEAWELSKGLKYEQIVECTGIAESQRETVAQIVQLLK